MDKNAIKEREKAVHALEQQMQLLEQDQESLVHMLHKLKEINQRKQKLEHYYFEKGYRADKEIEDNFENTYGLLSEDGLYNLFYEVDQAQLQIIKYLVNNL